MTNLSNQQLTSLKSYLHNHQELLQSQVRTAIENRKEESYKDLVETVLDVGDASVAKFHFDLETSLIEMRVNELQAIEAAKARLAEGSYGECTDCGEDIDYQRLAACPIAKRCIRCQSIHERLYSDRKYASL